MATFIQTLVTGLQMGSIYALIALGYTMVYGVVRLINFAHGDLIMAGGYTLLFVMPMILQVGMPPWIGIFFAMVVAVVIGAITEIFAYRPARKRGGTMASLIMAVSVSMVLQNLAQYLLRVTRTLYGATVKEIFPVGVIIIRTGGQQVSVRWATIITLLVSGVVALLLQILVNKTHAGRAMRAVAEDRDAAMLMGISPDRIVMLAMCLGSALAGIAAGLWFSIYPGTTPMVGANMGLFAFVSAVVGGIGSIPGAMVGGLVIGQIYSFSVSYVSSRLSDTMVFLMLICILLVKPKGLLGVNMREKV